MDVLVQSHYLPQVLLELRELVLVRLYHLLLLPHFLLQIANFLCIILYAFIELVGDVAFFDEFLLEFGFVSLHLLDHHPEFLVFVSEILCGSDL